MEGLSGEWIDIGNMRFVPFIGLKPGEFTFKVKDSNKDGVRNNNEISISIIVLPPFWKSIYAYLVYLVFIIRLIFAFIKMLEKKLLHDQEILKQKVLERTLQIEEKKSVNCFKK